MIRSTLLAAALSAAIGLALPRAADACGGFFCGGTPVSQSGEHIVFSVTDDPQTHTTTTEATIQIQYQGDPMKFAWVVPVHSQPVLDVGTDALFTYLDNLTQPVFNLEFTNQQCIFYGPTAAGAEDAGSAAVDGGTAGGGVTVVSQEDVGPYVTATLKADSDTALTQWLQSNGYQITQDGSQALQPYIGPDYYFVAVKLQTGANAGYLPPIMLRMQGELPCIPIQLTAIAAVSDMPIYAYFFAKGRAVATNYRDVTVNEARINWLQGGYNYTELATAAVAEAGGHAFLTEFAGSTASLAQNFHPSESLNTSILAMQTTPASFMQELIAQNFPRTGLLALLEQYIPEPKALVDQGVSEQQFYNQISYYQSYIDNDPGRAPFDAQGFANALQQQIVVPLQHAEQVMNTQPYLTRLYTTMSPINMTVDPDFDFNTGLGDVSNIHTAKATCDSSNPGGDITITLSDGRQLTESFSSGPPTNEPAAGVIQQLAPTGQPMIIRNNNVNAPAGCACSSAEWGPAGFVLAAFWLWRRRRIA